MRAPAFIFALCVLAVGATGVVAPSSLIWIAEHFVTPGAFYLVAALRIAFGLALISVASESRSPRSLRVLGYVILVAGVTTAVTGLLGIGRARAIVGDWLELGSGAVRLTGVAIVALGGFIAWACAPPRASVP